MATDLGTRYAAHSTARVIRTGITVITLTGVRASLTLGVQGILALTVRAAIRVTGIIRALIPVITVPGNDLTLAVSKVTLSTLAVLFTRVMITHDRCLTAFTGPGIT